VNYYDNVKDTVRNSKSGSGGGGFDTLKEAAAEEDIEEGDDTPIEVLEEGGLRRETSKKSAEESSKTVGEEKTGSADLSSIEDKLDKIIEQNDALIEIMESFKS